MKSDQDLMVLVCEGSHAAFTELVQRHTDRFYWLAFRTLSNEGDAQDVVQAAFIKLWQKPSSWRADKSQFTTWFYRVVLNACVDFQKKHRRSVVTPANEFDHLLAPVESEQASLEQRQVSAQRQRLLTQALSHLPATQRDAVNLVVYCALPQKQAACVMGVSVKAVESMLVRARRTMAAHVASDHELSASKALPIDNQAIPQTKVTPANPF